MLSEKYVARKILTLIKFMRGRKYFPLHRPHGPRPSRCPLHKKDREHVKSQSQTSSCATLLHIPFYPVAQTHSKRLCHLHNARMCRVQSCKYSSLLTPRPDTGPCAEYKKGQSEMSLIG